MSAVELPQVTWAGAGLGVVAIGIGLALSVVLRVVVRRLLRWRGRGEASARVFARLSGWSAVALGIVAALTVVFPSVKPVDILGGVGVVSIAAGIAFQTVLGNMFAGIVLLARDRFRIGDQIAVEDHRGTIVAMGLTSTSIRTFDGRLVLIPNVTLHSGIVTVQTGFEQVRTTVGMDIDDSVDLREACRIAERAMLAEPLVLDEPPPRALLTKIGSTTTHVELRFWSGARQLETREATHAVIIDVLTAFAERGVDTGNDTLVIEPGTRFERLLSSEELTQRRTAPPGD